MTIFLLSVKMLILLGQCEVSPISVTNVTKHDLDNLTWLKSAGLVKTEVNKETFVTQYVITKKGSDHLATLMNVKVEV